MAVTSGKPKEKITITIDHTNLSRVYSAISKGDFSNKSEAINKAIAFFFENRNKTDGQVIKEFMESSEGEELFKRLFKKYEESVSNSQE
jgi:Arc/MetJ-type ribon-helix-helix transcriptional regulator